MKNQDQPNCQQKATDIKFWSQSSGELKHEKGWSWKWWWYIALALFMATQSHKKELNIQ